MVEPGADHGRNVHTARILDRNIAALIARREAEERALRWQERAALAISNFAGSMPFVWVHLALYGGWILANTVGLAGIPRFDPSLVILAMAASVEAIFLSTFILITQNRMQAQAERRSELNLQISLLAEHEVTRLMQIVTDIAERLDVRPSHPDLPELKKDVHPEDVLDTIERHEEGSGRR